LDKLVTKRWLSLVLMLASAFVLVAKSFAHAFLDHALPAVGSTVREAPAEIKLWFSEKLEPAFSTAEVEDAARRKIAAATAKVDETDPTVIRISLPRLAPGTYRVVWRVLSVDTHVTKGDFTFDVGP
jgi:methionine-rich copper-binding protein CopC